MTLPSRAHPRTNWAGNISFAPARFERPSSIDELTELVADAPRVRVLGTGHSFNEIADTTGLQLSVAGLPEIIDLDEAARTVAVSAGTTYGRLGAALQAEGLALANTGSLPHISVAGAVLDRHPRVGDTLQNLSAMASAVELVIADGALRRIRRSVGDQFNGAVLALGHSGSSPAGTGRGAEHRRRAGPSYDGSRPADAGYFARRGVLRGYSVSVFTAWGRGEPGRCGARVSSRPSATPSRGGRVGTAAGRRTAAPGARRADRTATAHSAARPWIERLPHFRLEFTRARATSCSRSTWSPALSAPTPGPPWNRWATVRRGPADRRDPLDRRGSVVAQPESRA